MAPEPARVLPVTVMTCHDDHHVVVWLLRAVHLALLEGVSRHDTISSWLYLLGIPAVTEMMQHRVQVLQLQKPFRGAGILTGSNAYAALISCAKVFRVWWDT